VNWFRNHAFGSRTGEWLALALCFASLRLVFWFLTRKRDADEGEGENEYWRVHGGGDTTLSNGSKRGVDLDVETGE